MRKNITGYFAIIFAIAIIFPALAGAQEITRFLPEPKGSDLEKIQVPTVERKYIIFDNLDYWVDTCYIAALRMNKEYKEDLQVMPFSDATFNQIDITEYDAAIFPVGNSGPGGVAMPPVWGSRYGLGTATPGGIKIIDKIMEMVNAGKGVIVIGQNALWGNQSSPDPDVTNFLENIMGIDYQGKYECGETTHSGSTTEWRWWMFKVEGSLGDPVGVGLPKYYNGGDESSGQAIQPLSYFLEVDWFKTKDPQQYFITDRATTAQSDTAFGIRAEHVINDDTKSRIVFWSLGFEGYGGLYGIKKNMMLQAMVWVLGEPYRPEAEVQTDPGNLDFGGVDVATTETIDVSIRSTGAEPLEIEKIDLDYFFAEPEGSEAYQIEEGGLEEGGDPIVLEPGEEHKVTVSFTPDLDETKFTISLRIHSNAKNMPRLNLNVEGWGGEEKVEGGIYEANFEEIDFGTLEQEGVNKDVDLKLTNPGTIPILVSVYIDDEFNDSLSFSFAHTVNNPKYIDPGDTLTYTIRFFPLDEDMEYHGKVRVTVTNAINGNTFFVDLVGRSGIWSSVPGEASTEDGALTIKASPNPASDRTTININTRTIIPEKVDMYLIDLTGRQIAPIFSGVLPSGDHSVQFYSSMVSSGTYYIVGKIGGQTVTLPLLINK